MCNARLPQNTRRTRHAIRPVVYGENGDVYQAVERRGCKNKREQQPSDAHVGGNKVRPWSVSRHGGGQDDRRPEREEKEEVIVTNMREQHNDLGQCPVTGRLSDVNKEYVILPAVIGEGTFGKVRECVHRTTKKTYACKSIIKARMGRLDHLQREILLLEELDHKNVMRMVDCHEDAECVHIITEKYADGESHDDIVRGRSRRGRRGIRGCCASEERAARIVKGLLEAVAYLHDNDVVHRDIKPDNIMFDRSDNGEDGDDNEDDGANVRLIDFGLARRHSKSDPPMSDPWGTLYYQSPEVCAGSYGRSCDVWSVGVVAYVLLCGSPPFDGATREEVREAIKEGDLEFPSHSWMGRSEESVSFVRCLLRMDPRRRYTARAALRHPWIVNLGKQGGADGKRRGRQRDDKEEEAVQKKTESPRAVRYLRIC